MGVAIAVTSLAGRLFVWGETDGRGVCGKHLYHSDRLQRILSRGADCSEID